MKPLTYLCSLILILVGAVGYFGWEAVGAESQSITALIPAFVGIPMLLGALIAGKNHKVGMHIAVLFAALGAVAGLGRLVPKMLEGSLDWSAPAPVMTVVMTVVCLFYTILAIRSFIAARRAQQ